MEQTYKCQNIFRKLHNLRSNQHTNINFVHLNKYSHFGYEFNTHSHCIQLQSIKSHSWDPKIYVQNWWQHSCFISFTLNERNERNESTTWNPIRPKPNQTKVDTKCKLETYWIVHKFALRINAIRTTPAAAVFCPSQVLRTYNRYAKRLCQIFCRTIWIWSSLRIGLPREWILYWNVNVDIYFYVFAIFIDFLNSRFCVKQNG